MNTQNTPPPYPEPEPASDAAKAETEAPKKGFLRKAFPFAAVAVVSMIIGGAMGSTNETPSGNAAEKQESEDAVVEPTETKTETVTETVEVEVSNQQCLDALDHADDAIDIYSRALSTAGDGLLAYSEGDYATLDESTAEIEAMTGELTTTLTDYYINSEECRA